MGAAYISQVISKSATSATIRVFQTHPDYGLDPEYFVEEWGAMAIAGWAFADCYAYTHTGHTARNKATKRLLQDGETTPLGKLIGNFNNLFETPASDVKAVTLNHVHLVREAYNDENRGERLVAAGYDEKQELFLSVVLKICGQLDLEISVDDPQLLEKLEVGVEWEY